MKRQDLVHLFSSIRMWRRRDERAPHKPLLLLMALAEVQRGGERMMPFVEADRVLEKLLREFGPPRQAYHTEYPFWRLQNDQGVWELEGAEDVQRRGSITDAKKSELIEHSVRGGLSREVHQALRENPAMLADAARILLNNAFEASLHADICAAIGLDLRLSTTSDGENERGFRRDVLRAYGHACSVCRFDAWLDESVVGVEAGHIKWPQAGGSDVMTNGLALCTLHHRLFHRGCFTLEPEEYLVEVSRGAHGGSGFEQMLLVFHGRRIAVPQAVEERPGAEFVQWHRREVFRGPARA